MAVIYVSSGRGIQKSSDGGNTWTEVFPADSFRTLTVHPATPETIYAISDLGYLFKSTDTGTSWRFISGAMQAPNLAYSFSVSDPTDASLQAPILVSPADGAVFDIYPRKTNLRWSPSSGASSYLLEWDFSSSGNWQSERQTERMSSRPFKVRSSVSNSLELNPAVGESFP